MTSVRTPYCLWRINGSPSHETMQVNAVGETVEAIKNTVHECWCQYLTHTCQHSLKWTPIGGILMTFKGFFWIYSYFAHSNHCNSKLLNMQQQNQKSTFSNSAINNVFSFNVTTASSARNSNLKAGTEGHWNRYTTDVVSIIMNRLLYKYCDY
jgi:hypothetical protein